MKRCLLTTSLCIVLFGLVLGPSALRTQEAPKNPQTKPNPIEGVWIEVSVEREGSQLLVPSIKDARSASMLVHEPYLWRIAEGTIEEGPPEKDKLPRWRSTYKLDPDNQEGSIDLIYFDEENSKKEEKPKKQLAIYFVKDDYLMICIGQDSRPTRFASSKENPNLVYLLRRFKPKFADSDAAKPSRKNK